MNVKPGDMAIVIRDREPENLMLVLEVGSGFKCFCGAAGWYCTSTGRSIVSRFGPFTRFSRCAGFHDSDLRPIFGLDDPDAKERAEPVGLEPTSA